MEIRPDTPTAQPATPRRALKRLALAAALVAGVVVFGDIGVIGYNLLRTVPTPTIVLKQTTTRPASEASANPTMATTGAATTAPPGRPDALTTAVLDRPTLDRPIPELIPLASLSQPDQVEKARAINAQYAGCVRTLRDYLAQKDRLDYETSKKMLHANDGPITKIYRALDCDFVDLIRRESYRDFEWIDRMYVAEGVTYNKLIMDLAVRHERWFDAAIWSRMNRNWDEEVYYLRKAGPLGRTILAKRSTERTYQALKYSLLSIGPDFHLPKMEDWY